MADDATPSGTRARPGRSLALGRVGLAAALVLALLVVVALASTASGPFTDDTAGEARAPSRGLLDYAFTIGLVVVLTMMAGIAYLLRPTGRWKNTEGRTPLHFLPLVLALGIYSALIIAVFSLWEPVGRDRPLPTQRGATGEAGGVPTLKAPAAAPYEPQFRWSIVVAAAVVAIAAVVAAYMIRRRSRRTLVSSPQELVTELRAMLDIALDDLRAEQDPRRAVIAAYARMERALAAFGHARRPFEAPFEYLERIGPALAASVSSARTLVFELTHLFERAKFSPHEVDTQMKDEALASLTELRNELVALQEEHAPAAA